MIKKNNGRVCILLMDSFGIGASLDADRYGDSGANTFGNILAACKDKPLDIPNLARIGLYHAAIASCAKPLYDLSKLPEPIGYYGYAVEQSKGKDTPSGHWELAGVPVHYDWGYFTDNAPCFPKQLIDDLVKQAKLPGVLGNKHASGTTIIEELGAEHIESGKPIVYTSADSVFQIAAHEEHFGLDKLYQICEIARCLVDQYNVGRVIARPFIGKPGQFKRTGNRKDYATPPPLPTLLDKLKAKGHQVIGIGKIGDIFAHQGLTQEIKADGNMALFDATIETMKSAPAGGLVFTNFVDFDSSFGHRRDVKGYGKALEDFDTRIPELETLLQPDDIVVIAADHGCDPTFHGSDHTREHIPVLVFGPSLSSQFIGRRDTFADIGQSIAHYLGLEPLDEGISFL